MTLKRRHDSYARLASMATGRIVLPAANRGTAWEPERNARRW